MNSRRRGSLLQIIRECAAILCAVVLLPGNAAVAAQDQQPAAAPEQAAVKIPADQLDSLVAPIALYPDPMLSQTLVASTYPLEVIQLQQWLAQNKGMNEKQLAEAVKKQDWDPSIQGLAALPDVVKLLSENIKWTTDLGNAFLAQQNDVMDAVQRMRKKAQDAGNLKSSEQQKVETKDVESKQVIVVEQANPQVVYVPSYNPTVVYGAPVYAYPPIAYPPPGYYAAGMAISFGVGVAMGAMWSGGWGYNCGWGGNNNVTINNNNNFVNNSNRQNINNANRGNRPANQPARGNSNWQHNPQHRGGAPYCDRDYCEQVWWHYAWRLHAEPAGERTAEPGPAAACGRRPRYVRIDGTGPRRGHRIGTRLTAEVVPVLARAIRPTVAGRAIRENRGGGGDRVGNQQVRKLRVRRTETRSVERAAA